VKGEDTHTKNLLESVTRRERKEGIFLKEISVRVIKELHPKISPKEKRASGQQQRDQVADRFELQVQAIQSCRKCHTR
jgi:hypothetical protein